jgi:uncharacterized membrane protein YjjB (DUF3815 family)
MSDLATVIVATLLAFGLGCFLVAFLLGLRRHFLWSRRTRKRIGWYT